MAKQRRKKDRRKHLRYILSEDVYIHRKNDRTKNGQILDIGLGGFRVHYLDNNDTAEPWHWRVRKMLMPGYDGCYNISITINGEDCGLKQVPCKTISKAGPSGVSRSENGNRKCVQFGYLRHDHVFHLKKLILGNFVKPVQDRRQRTDRRNNQPGTFSGSEDRRKSGHERRVFQQIS